MSDTPDRDLVLCPGFMNDHRLWARMESGLAGMGTPYFTDQSQDNSLEGMAARALDAAPEKFILIGFSMGGYVAREIIKQAPERVQALVLMNTSARPDTDAFKSRNRIALAATQAKGFRGLARAALKRALHPDRRDDEDLLAHIEAMGLRMGEAAFLNQLALTRADDCPALAQITCPTLVIWSRQDDLRSLEEFQESADGISGARLEIIEDCGHMTPLEAPEAALGILIRWLTANGL